MNDLISLLTQFSWRFGFNSRGLKSIGLISSSADVRRSRGNFDWIWQNFVINPTPIGSHSSLNAGGSRWTQDLAQILLNCFTIQSRVKRKRESSLVFKEEFPREIQVVRFGEDWSMAAIVRWSWAMIPRPMIESLFWSVRWGSEALDASTSLVNSGHDLTS